LEVLMYNIQAYESDEVIFNTAFDDAAAEFDFLPQLEDFDGNEDQFKAADKMVRKRIRNKFLRDKMTLTIKMGLGATSPERKSAALNATLQAVSQNEAQQARINWDEVTKEQFAIGRSQHGRRSLKSEEDGEQQLTEEDLEAARQQGMQEAGMQMKEMELQTKERIADKDREAKMMEVQMQIEKEIIIHQQGVGLKEKLDMLMIQSNERMAALREGNKANEILLKDKRGEGTTGTGV